MTRLVTKIEFVGFIVAKVQSQEKFCKFSMNTGTPCLLAYALMVAGGICGVLHPGCPGYLEAMVS